MTTSSWWFSYFSWGSETKSWPGLHPSLPSLPATSIGGCTSPLPRNAPSRGNRSLLATSPWKSCPMGFWGTNVFGVWHERGCSFFQLGFVCLFFLQVGKPPNIIVFGIHSFCTRHMELMFLRLTALLYQSSWSFLFNQAMLEPIVICHFLFSTPSTKRTSCKNQKKSNQRGVEL